MLVGVLIHRMGHFPLLALATLAATLAGFWVVRCYTAGMEDKDRPEIVIDELAGQWIALCAPSAGFWAAGLPATNFPWPGWLAAFLFFRLFDIWKPWIIGQADRRGDANGVMLDDILAGIFAGIATMAFGLLDDWVGPRTVIIGSLIGLIACGLGVFFLHTGGPKVFWVLGLAMCMFVGPAQSAARSYLARIIPAGRSGEIFGLYATTGRAISFLSPTLFGVAVSLGAAISGDDTTQYWGILGIVVVLVIGLLAMFFVRSPRMEPAAELS